MRLRTLRRQIRKARDYTWRDLDGPFPVPCTECGEIRELPRKERPFWYQCEHCGSWGLQYDFDTDDSLVLELMQRGPGS